MLWTDYSNCLISGSTMRPITDKLYISREKLAQIVDSSAAALASLAPISGWIGFELSLIADELKNLASEGADLSKYPQSAYVLFLGTIPTRRLPPPSPPSSVGALAYVAVNLARSLCPMPRCVFSNPACPVDPCLRSCIRARAHARLFVVMGGGGERGGFGRLPHHVPL